MTPREILDACAHLSGWNFADGHQKFTEGKPPCRDCAERAIAAAVEASAMVLVMEAEKLRDGAAGEDIADDLDRLAAAIRARGGK